MKNNKNRVNFKQLSVAESNQKNVADFMEIIHNNEKNEQLSLINQNELAKGPLNKIEDFEIIKSEKTIKLKKETPNNQVNHVFSFKKMFETTINSLALESIKFLIKVLWQISTFSGKMGSLIITLSFD